MVWKIIDDRQTDRLTRTAILGQILYIIIFTTIKGSKTNSVLSQNNVMFHSACRFQFTPIFPSGNPKFFGI